MSVLHDLIREHASGDPDQTAAAVLDALGCPKRWRVVFGGLLRDECRRQMRASVRDAESAAPTGQNRPDTHSTSAGGGSRTDYLTQRFYNGTCYVLWGEATVADHRARIAFLTKLRGGIDATIRSHTEAITRIESAEVTCLGDLDRRLVA